MNLNSGRIRRWLRAAQRGQALVITTVAIIGILGMAALVIDVSRVYYAYQELLTSTQAAALAGATDLATDTASGAGTVATNYSSVNGKLNAIANLADLAGKVNVTVRADSAEGFDKNKLQNGVLEPLRESDLIK